MIYHTTKHYLYSTKSRQIEFLSISLHLRSQKIEITLMKKKFLSSLNLGIIYIVFTAIISALVVYSVFLIKELRIKETARVGLFVKAMELLQDNTNSLSSDAQSLILPILEENNQLPVIVTDAEKHPLLTIGTYRNIPEDIIQNPEKLKRYIQNMENNYPPFEMKIGDNHKQLVFYDNSPLLNNLQYYPYFLGLFILSYLIVSVWFMNIMKRKDEGLLWAGLAKETAHQIGTPLSSMIGWTEILKIEHPESVGVLEMEQDILRLKTISERFSKVGSVPELNEYNLKETLQLTYDYLKNRISSKVKFRIQMPKEDILLPHNRILFSWVIENLTKNAVDAMKGMGELTINLYEKNKVMIIDIHDTGCGMTKKQARNVFKAGYSTKKRGWGLGLSLAQRVIKDYHKGHIYIAETEQGKGSTFRIKLFL